MQTGLSLCFCGLAMSGPKEFLFMCEREEEREGERKGEREEVWKLVGLGPGKQHMGSGLPVEWMGFTKCG